MTKMPGSLTGVYVGAVVVLSAVSVLAIVALLILRPGQDNTNEITTIIAFLGPILAGLLGAALREVHVAFNSRMSEMLEMTARASKAEGKVEQTAQTAAAVPHAQPTSQGGDRRASPVPPTAIQSGDVVEIKKAD